jgi:hypothetical protein
VFVVKFGEFNRNYGVERWYQFKPSFFLSTDKDVFWVDVIKFFEVVLLCLLIPSGSRLVFRKDYSG